MLRTALLILAATPALAQDSIELVETFPVETELDNPDLREAYEVWPERISAAREHIELAWFYVSDRPGSRLEPIVGALIEAAERDVSVRLLSDKGFHDTYPETLDALGAHAGIEVRLFDVRALTGGVLHAKYFLIDGRETWLGSQNFDWRSLEHIQELGVLVRNTEITRAFGEVFEADWALAGGEATSVPASDEPPRSVSLRFGDAIVVATPVASPKDWLPGEAWWDLPKLTTVIDEARETVRIQLLTYRSQNRDGTTFDLIQNALVRAAQRGVKVELLVADWGKRKGTIEGLQELVRLEGLAVKMVAIPEHSSGFVPFSRVIHSKYLVVDGARAWIGTSNWEQGYFFRSRNVGLILEGEAFGARLDRYFEKGWNSPLAEAVDPRATYEPPRIGR
jgi:phosphatidylserine/phosphatidylglycerophosphate/cardiolipin synthase-like enzyme